jgi:hypothetical protein
MGDTRPKIFVGEILMNGKKNVILYVGADGNRPALGIENRFTGVGRPEAVARHGKRLNNRQQRLLDKLPEYNSRVTIKKSDVSMIDLAALTAKENVEFAMFTRGPERLIVRGDMESVKVNPIDAITLNAQGYKWSGHTHIGNYLIESRGDNDVLKQFSKKRSVVYDSMGRFRIFFAR